MTSRELEQWAQRPHARPVDDAGHVPADLIHEDCTKARRDLLRGRKLADRHGEGDIHRRLCEITSDLDDVIAVLADRRHG